MSKRYGKCTDNPEGVVEDSTRCITTIYASTGWYNFQCSRKRGHGPEGLYCKQHGKKVKEKLNE